MKNVFVLMMVMLWAAGAAPAETTRSISATLGIFSQPAATTQATQGWASGWDIFSEPLNFRQSNIVWTTSSTTHTLTVNYTLVGAKPEKLYQVGAHFFCSRFPATFGQFPSDSHGGPCTPITRQGVTKSIAAVEFGVVTTDIHGNGSFRVVIGPIAKGTYQLEFDARNGAGCNLTGGGANSQVCAMDFQSPGPFGKTTTITIQ